MTPLQQLQQRAREQYLAHHTCINGGCDNNGCIVAMDANGEQVQQQCEYCYRERFPQADLFDTLIAEAFEKGGEVERESFKRWLNAREEDLQEEIVKSGLDYDDHVGTRIYEVRKIRDEALTPVSNDSV